MHDVDSADHAAHSISDEREFDLEQLALMELRGIADVLQYYIFCTLSQRKVDERLWSRSSILASPTE